MEESSKERAFALAKRARQALPQGEELSEVETALHLLIQAVENLTDQVSIPAFGEFSNEAIERLFGKITKGVELPELDKFDREESTMSPGKWGMAEDSRTFIVSFPDIELTEKEVWPDGDAPEFPSPSDVVEAMRASALSVPTCIKDWLLVQELSVRSSMNTEEVEWDGT